MPNYTMYHCHSDYSLLDSCTKFSDYIELAKRDGMTAIGSTEHGLPRGNISKMIACQEAGLKFLYGVEVYLTRTLAEEKVRDNYHTVLIARNHEGMKEINLAVKLASRDDHFYYQPRMTFDELIRLSKNVIVISACIASPLSKLQISDKDYQRLLNRYDYLEIQHHNHPSQAAYNQHLYQLSLETGKPLIAGTDTHSSTPYKAECRDLLMLAKGKSFPDEETFDLTYKTYDELVSAYEKQGALPRDVYLQAIENTNVMAASVEDFTVDRSNKYPISYGSAEEDARRYKELTWQMFEDKLHTGVIPKCQEEAFRSAIVEELAAFEKLGMCGFMLSESELVRWCHANGMPTGPARGSVGGSRVAYITDIIDLNPENYGTIFSRFCNADRISIGDIDLDVVDTDRPKIFNHIIERFGERKTARVSAYGTIADKGAIDDICRGLKNRYVAENRPDLNVRTYTDDDVQEFPYTLKNVDRIKKEYEANPNEAKLKYPDIFYYFNGTVNTIVSQSVHAAGMVISPCTLDDNYGTFINSGEHCLLLNMDEAHDVGMCKYDLLILTNIKIIDDVYKAIGKPFPKMHEIDFNDQNVWRDMRRSQWGVFQAESDFFYNSLKRMKPTSIKEMALLTASIRPSGASYRDDVFDRKVHTNPTKEMDELFKDNFGFVVYQEDISRALIELCGFSGSQADTVRRDIAKKDQEKIAKDIVLIKQGYIDHSDKPREVAEHDVAELLQVISDASGYAFNYSHAVAYCMIGFLCAYCRYYYPLEFCTAYLNGAHTQDDIYHGTTLAQLYGINIQMPVWGHTGEEYTFDRATNTIYQGLASVKSLSSGIGDKLHEIEYIVEPSCFTDLLLALKADGIGDKQIEILISIGYFVDFGNSAELQKILENAIKLKYGNLTWLSEEKRLALFGEAEGEIGQYAERRTEKNWKVADGAGLLRYMEQCVKARKLPPPPLREMFATWMEYIGYIPALGPEYRALMYITEPPKTLMSKKTGRPWAYSIMAISLRTAEMHEWTIRREMYVNALKSGDIIRVVGGKNGYTCKEYMGTMRYYLFNYKIIDNL